MSATPYSVDADQEYFEFTFNGHLYKFRHLTTEELTEMTLIKDDNVKSLEYLSRFITSEDNDAPSFTEVAKKWTAPNWKKFRQMLEAEMGA